MRELKPLKIRRLLAAATVSALALGIMPAHAGTETATYVAANHVWLTDGYPGYGVGAYRFSHPTARYTQLQIVDQGGQSGLAVQVIAEGTEGSTSHVYCTPPGGLVSLEGNLIGEDILVFIPITTREGHDGWPDCPGIATTGTITASY